MTEKKYLKEMYINQLGEKQLFMETSGGYYIGSLFTNKPIKVIFKLNGGIMLQVDEFNFIHCKDIRFQSNTIVDLTV